MRCESVTVLAIADSVVLACNGLRLPIVTVAAMAVSVPLASTWRLTAMRCDSVTVLVKEVSVVVASTLLRSG